MTHYGEFEGCVLRGWWYLPTTLLTLRCNQYLLRIPWLASCLCDRIAGHGVQGSFGLLFGIAFTAYAALTVGLLGSILFKSIRKTSVTKIPSWLFS